MAHHLPADRDAAGDERRSRTILLVANDYVRSAKIAFALHANGVHAQIAASRAEALWCARQMSPALVVLDLNEDENWELLSELQRLHFGIVALADAPVARTKALRAGCLKICAGTWTPEEIGAYVLAALPERARAGVLRLGSLVIDQDRRRVTFRNKSIELAPVLFDVLALLAAHPGKFITTQTLLEEVWGEPWGSGGKVHIAVLRLRRKLGLSAASKILIARRGHGYGLFL